MSRRRRAQRDAVPKPGAHRRDPSRYLFAVVGVFVVAIVGAGAVASQPWVGGATAPQGYSDAIGRPAGDSLEDRGEPGVSSRAFRISPSPQGGNGSGPEPSDPSSSRPAGFPDEQTTGVPDGVTLSRSGSITVRDDGAVIENVYIVDGTIEVYANDVTIRNVRITNEDSFVQWGIHQRDGYGGMVVEDSEIYGSPDSSHQLASAISNHGGTLTVRRVEIHGISDGIVTSQGVIEDSYLHSPRYFPGDHTDMIQSNGGAREGMSLVIRHNTVINTQDQTAAIFLQSSTGHGERQVHDVLIEGNLLAGGGYTIYGGGSDAVDVVIRDNVFSRSVFRNGGRYGPVAYFEDGAPGNAWLGNEWEDGRPVRLD